MIAVSTALAWVVVGAVIGLWVIVAVVAAFAWDAYLRYGRHATDALLALGCTIICVVGATAWVAVMLQ